MHRKHRAEQAACCFILLREIIIKRLNMESYYAEHAQPGKLPDNTPMESISSLKSEGIPAEGYRDSCYFIRDIGE